MTAHRTRLYHRLQLAAHRVQKAADRAVMEAAGVTTAQAAVLTVTAAAEPVTQRVVADQLGLNESALTQMTARLMKLGLLARTRDKDDARAWLLSLTAEGRTALARIRAPFTRINTAMDKALGDEEAERLAEALTRIAKTFGG